MKILTSDDQAVYLLFEPEQSGLGSSMLGLQALLEDDTHLPIVTKMLKLFVVMTHINL